MRGRWLNTQENAFVLLALKRYFEAYEEVTPDFVARAATPGAFIAPPARAEEMCKPETFGRSGSDRMLIE